MLPEILEKLFIGIDCDLYCISMSRLTGRDLLGSFYGDIGWVCGSERIFVCGIEIDLDDDLDYGVVRIVHVADHGVRDYLSGVTMNSRGIGDG